MRKIFRELTDVNKSRELLYEHAKTKKLSSERIKLLESLGRVLENDIHSPINVPPFDRGSMDGFAVISADLLGAEEDNPIILKVIGDVKAGYTFLGIVGKGTCVEISTGAPLPTGADSVVMVEYTQRKDESVAITTMVTPGENVMAAGTDIQKGERVIEGKTVLTSRELAVLAAMGIDEVSVIKKPKIGVFSSGDEIIELGMNLEPGKLYDINSTAIISSIIEQGGEPTYLGILKDNYDEIFSNLKENLDKFELLIISGGTSAGMGDMLYEIIDKLGSPGLLVHGIKVKPGKPTILGVVDKTTIIGLPGYPASALSIYKLFVVPLIKMLGGLPPEVSGDTITAIVKQRLRSVMGRHEFKPMNIIKSDEKYIAYPVPGGSGAITSIALADGFVEIPENVNYILADTEIEISLLSKGITLPDIQFIGSHCIALAKLQTLFSEKYPLYHSRSIAVGSTGGVASIRRGEAHIAGIHLLNGDGEYNKWVLQNTDAILVKGYNRKQGFIVKKGNPKEIYSITDLIRDDVRMINRNPGSGTRILLDLFIKKIGIDQAEIKGYNNFVRSHSSVAQVVKTSFVDVGLGIESVVDDKLEFIFLREEEYDFLIGKKYSELPAVKEFIKILQSDDFISILNGLKGYSIRN